MSSTVEVLSQHLSLRNVRALVITEIVATGDSFTRAVRFFGEPVVDGIPSLLLDVTLVSADRASLEISTPVLQF